MNPFSIAVPTPLNAGHDLLSHIITLEKSFNDHDHVSRRHKPDTDTSDDHSNEADVSGDHSGDMDNEMENNAFGGVVGMEKKHDDHTDDTDHTDHADHKGRMSRNR